MRHAALLSAIALATLSCNAEGVQHLIQGTPTPIPTATATPTATVTPTPTRTPRPTQPPRETNNSDCLSTWKDYATPDSIATLGVYYIVDLLLNTKMLPNTVGEYLQLCLEEGWRPPELP